MTKFFVPNNIYEDRMAICKSCDHYSSVLGNCLKCGCFMRIKSRISLLSCPINKWTKTTEIEIPDELPKELIQEILDVWENIKSGRATDGDAKTKTIELYNTIHNTNYSPTTNCGSCLSTCYNGIKKLYKKYSE